MGALIAALGLGMIIGAVITLGFALSYGMAVGEVAIEKQDETTQD